MAILILLSYDKINMRNILRGPRSILLSPLLIIFALILGAIAIVIFSPNQTEGYYFNQVRDCLVEPQSYPGWWRRTYGDGETYPYAKPNSFFSEQPIECGGCLSSFTQYKNDF